MQAPSVAIIVGVIGVKLGIGPGGGINGIRLDGRLGEATAFDIGSVIDRTVD